MRRSAFRAAALGVLILASAAPLWAAAKPTVYTSVTPRSVTVGEPVTLTVEVYVPNFFTGAPRFPQLEVKDAVVIFQEQGGTNLNQQIGEVAYAGQQRKYAIYPQRAGEFEVPPFAVSVRYSIDGKPSASTPVQAKGGHFSATVPDAAKGLEHFIATPSFQLTAEADRASEGLKEGDSLTRTITMTALQAFAIMLPPLSFPATDGIAVYPGQPRLSDSPGERGEARVARRVETVTYVFKRQGSYRLPAIQIAWWDTRARTLRTAALPELTLAVAANPSPAPEIALPQDPATRPAPDPWKPLREGLRRYAPAALGLLLALAILYRLFGARLHALRARRAARQAVQRESAAAYLERLQAVARAGSPAEILAAAYRWLDRRDANGSAARLDRFAERSGDAELPALANGLVDAVLSGGRTGNGSSQRFVEALVRHAERQPGQPTPTGSLGPLNPRS
jgi:hypothetical protein